MITIDKNKFKEWRAERACQEMQRLVAQMEHEPNASDKQLITLFMDLVMYDVLAFVRDAEREQEKTEK